MKHKADTGLPGWLQPTMPESAQASPAPAPYVDRSALVAELAPVAPPCFESRDSWVTYLQSAAAEQREKHVAGPLLIRKGEPVVFNRRFFMCVDCDAQHAHTMWMAGRCRPNYLMTLPEQEVFVPLKVEGADAPSA